MYIEPGARAVILCEKGFIAEALAKAWAGIHPEVEFWCVTTSYGVPGGFATRLPREMPLSAVPALADPLFKTEDIRLQVIGPDGRISDRCGIQLLEQADLYICATDPDHSGVYGFWNLLRHYMGRPVADQRHLLINIYDISPEALRKSVYDMCYTDDLKYQSLLAAAKIKRRFDASWAVNAIPCFAPILKDLGVLDGQRFVSKNALQLLYWMQQECVLKTEGQLIYAMAEWQGTGKYKRINRRYYPKISPTEDLMAAVREAFEGDSLDERLALLLNGLDPLCLGGLLDQAQLKACEAALPHRGGVNYLRIRDIQPEPLRDRIVKAAADMGLIPKDTLSTSVLFNYVHMGSPASRHAIVEGLAQQGLLESAQLPVVIRVASKRDPEDRINLLVELAREGKLLLPAEASVIGYRKYFKALANDTDASVTRLVDAWRISRRGKDFLAALHPRCMDLDLSFRLSEWMDTGEPATASMEAWIRRFFGRQRLFMMKKTKAEATQ